MTSFRDLYPKGSPGFLTIHCTYCKRKKVFLRLSHQGWRRFKRNIHNWILWNGWMRNVGAKCSYYCDRCAYAPWIES